MNENLAQRLRALRDRHRLSQRQLARRTGVANATISQIESGRLNPTVSLLKKILDGIPVSLSEFFSDPSEEAADRVFFRAAELTEIADGGVSYRQVGAHLGDRAIQLLKERYEPGAGTGRHALRARGRGMRSGPVRTPQGHGRRPVTGARARRRLLLPEQPAACVPQSRQRCLRAHLRLQPADVLVAGDPVRAYQQRRTGQAAPLGGRVTAFRPAWFPGNIQGRQ